MFKVIFILYKNKAEFSEYIIYTRNLGFEQDPDYNYLRGLFKTVMQKNKYENDFEFDWVKKLNLDRSKSKLFY